MEIVQRPVESLREYARNPRRNDSVVDKMVASIKEFGFKVPILARSDGLVVDGHLRLKAARKLGMLEVPVILCDEWSEAQVKAFRLMANRSVTWAEWDEELLKIEFDDLKAFDFPLDLTGFDAREIEALVQEGTTDPEPQFDNAAELQAKWETALWQIWNIGKHRLYIGDALSAEPSQADGICTDPPYDLGVDVVRQEACWSVRDARDGLTNGVARKLLEISLVNGLEAS